MTFYHLSVSTIGWEHDVPNMARSVIFPSHSCRQAIQQRRGNIKVTMKGLGWFNTNNINGRGRGEMDCLKAWKLGLGGSKGGGLGGTGTCFDEQNRVVEEGREA